MIGVGALTAAIIASEVSANSVQAAPVGVAIKISAAALSGSATTTATIFDTTKTMVMIRWPTKPRRPTRRWR